MFDSVRLPHRLDKQQFAALSEPLREKLLDAQFELAERKHKTVLLLINGSDGAGKGEVLNRLYDWLDDHYLETLSYGPPTEEERSRPLEWRYWRDMPANGRVGLVLGSWHHRVLRDRVLKRTDRDAFNTALEEINRVEEMLYRENVVVIKVWLHVAEEEARRRLAKKREAEWRAASSHGDRMGRNPRRRGARAARADRAGDGRENLHRIRALGGGGGGGRPLSRRRRRRFAAAHARTRKRRERSRPARAKAGRRRLAGRPAARQPRLRARS